MRLAWTVAACVVVVAVVMFSGLFEHFSSGDLDAIRGAESSLLTACAGRGDAQAAERSASVLIGYLERDPDQRLPLHGAGPASSMRSEMTRLLATTQTPACAPLANLKARMAEALERDP